MNTLLQALTNPGELTANQWLVIVFLLALLLPIAWRLYKQDRRRQSKPYVPNIRGRLDAKRAAQLRALSEEQKQNPSEKTE
ncbi:MAG: hypothetical protein LBE21_06030 [Pseudomonadales bacterium]|jgi:predicted negative regulator of RcsB-dependent stress response|nr:hypothetical protein [Pseudomonadales bacterium]